MEEIVVIGGGLMGSSSAWQLSKYGARVLLIEQQDSVYSYGSSFGDARISRSLGPKGDLFSWLQQTSVAETQELLAYLNEADGHGTHHMEEIFTTSPVTYLFYDSQKATVDDVLNGQKDPHEVAKGSKQARESFGMKVEDSVTVIREFKPYSGTLNPKILIHKLQQAIVKKGNRIQYHTRVSKLVRKDGYYLLELTDTETGATKTIKAIKVISAAGPYTGQLLKNVAPHMDSLITAQRLFLAFFKPRENFWKSMNQEQKGRLEKFYPVADLDAELFYSMIEGFEDTIPVFKVGGHFLRTPVINLDEVWTQPLFPQEKKWARERTLDYWEALGISAPLQALEYIKGYSCVYSLTESEIPLVTPLVYPDGSTDPNLVVVAGLSGVGAKGSLAYGLLAADQLTGNSSEKEMYQKAIKMMGPERLQQDLIALEKKRVKRLASAQKTDGSLLFKGTGDKL